MNSNLTDNKNLLQPTNFKLTIDSTQYANTQFFCTTVNLPGTSKGPVEAKFKNEIGYFPGDTTTYSELTISFLVDEEMKNYIEIYDWLQNGLSTSPIFKDISLSILSNKNTTNRIIQFKDAFPISISDLEFTSQAAEIEYLTCSVTFKFNKFVFVK
jgi:hypothetical protein